MDGTAWPAQRRAFDAVPPRTLTDLAALHSAPMALRCFTHGCIACSEFDVERRATYEERRLKGHTIVPWNCADAENRALAMAAGVTELPAYLVLRQRDRRPIVLRP